MAVAHVVTPSALVWAALEGSVRAYFDAVTRSSSIGGIKSPFTDTDVIFYDLTSPQTEVAALLRYGASQEGFLPRLLVVTREGTDLADLVPLVGVAGAILPHSSTAEEIAITARGMRSGLSILPTGILTQWKMSRHDSADLDLTAKFGLTHREKEVLLLLAQGQSNKAIARQLEINDTTVRVYVRSILHKLGVSNRTQAALLFSRNNMSKIANGGGETNIL